MSPRAAWRLERLGFAEVYDYVPGKQDWLSFNLPSEGTADLVGAHLQRDVLTCHLDERLADLQDRVAASRYGMSVVVDGDGIVAGLLPQQALHDGLGDTAEHAMHPGPTTVRPSEERSGLEHRMQHAGVRQILVTSSDGCLLGIFRPDS